MPNTILAAKADSLYTEASAGSLDAQMQRDHELKTWNLQRTTEQMTSVQGHWSIKKWVAWRSAFDETFGFLLLFDLVGRRPKTFSMRKL